MNKILLPLLAASLAFGVAYKASADITLYDNGATNGNEGVYLLNSGNTVGDSFTLTSESIVTGVNFGVWNGSDGSTELPEAISQIDWSITSVPLSDTGIANGTASVASSSDFINDFGYYVDEDSFSTGSVDLLPGTYYLNLENAVVTGTYPTDPAYWDENDGPSLAFDTDDVGAIPSESFQIVETSDSLATPEPGGLVMMVIGCTFVGFFLLRRRQAFVS